MTDGKVTQEDFSNNETQAMLETIFSEDMIQALSSLLLLSQTKMTNIRMYSLWEYALKQSLRKAVRLSIRI